MSLNPNELNKAKKLLKEIDAIYKSIGEKSPFSDPSQVNNLKQLTDELKTAQGYVNLLDDDASSIFSSFKSITEEINGQNKAYSTSSSSLKSLTSLSQKLRDHQDGISKLSVSQLQTLQSKAKSEKENLKVNRDILQDKLNQNNISNKELVMLTNINGLLGENDSSLQSILHTANEEIKARKTIEKQLGIAGGIIKGIGKIPILGNLFDSKETLDEMEKTLKNKKGSVSALGAGFKNIGKQIREGMLNPANLVLGVITGLIAGFVQSQKSIGELAKGLGMSASSATQMRQEFAGIANSSMNANISVKGLQDSQMAVGQALGTNVKLNEKDLITMTDIVKKTGMQHKELMGIQKLSLAQGKDLDKNLKSTLGGATAYASQNKLVVDVNKTLKEVNNASSSLKLSLGGSVEELGRAVMQTQKFGITLQQAESISKGLLSFEQSISAELEAELLTGKDINFEKARQFALEGDIAKASEEVLKQLKGSEEFSKMNVIQQEAMAKAVGMTREELASSLIEREALQKMSAQEGESASKAYERLKASGKTEKEIVELLGEKTAQQLEQQSAQDKFNASVEKLREIFVQVMDAVAPIFDVLSSIVTTILPAINYALQPIMMMFSGLSKIISGNLEDLSGWEVILASIAAGVATIYTVTKATAAIQKVQQTIDGVRLGYQAAMGSMEAKRQILEKKGLVLSIGKAAMGAIQSLASIPVIGWGLGLAAAGTVAALGYSYMKDGVIGPGGEMVVSGPKGSIQLDKDDSIIAGTNLFGDDKKQQPTQSQPSPQPQQASVDMSQTNALLQQLINVIQSGGDVMLDGQKVGTALKLGTYQTQ
jgi:hypothetical protein